MDLGIDHDCDFPCNPIDKSPLSQLFERGCKIPTIQLIVENIHNCHFTGAYSRDMRCVRAGFSRADETWARRWALAPEANDHFADHISSAVKAAVFICRSTARLKTCPFKPAHPPAHELLTGAISHAYEDHL
jgi:hypothetical protein